MKLKERFWEWFGEKCYDLDLDIKVPGLLVLLVSAGILTGGFLLASKLVSPLQLTGFTKNVIISLIDVCIFVPGIVLVLTHFVILIVDIKDIWNQLKSNSRSVWNQFMSFIRNNALIFVLVLIYVLFYRFWETWLGNHIIDPFLCHLESNLQNDVIFIIATIICIVLIYVKIICVFRRTAIKRVNQQTIVFSIIAIVIWAFYRFNHGLCGMTDSAYHLGFIPLSTYNPIKYFDIVFVVAIYEYMSFILGASQDSIASTFRDSGDVGLTRSLPISGKEKDLLERDGFAKSIVEELWGTDTSSSSFTCGIDAPWGSGKTSFINLMKNHLESNHKNKIIIDFNPWLYAAEKDLVTAFFDELSKTLKQCDNSLARNLIDYAKLLSAFNTSETKLISSLIDLVQHNNNSLQEKKKKISEAIKRFNRKIFVFIDDLDRLEANEILEMMKLIRNVSDFPYIYIIAAYDKSYVIRCLSTKMKSSANNFIEKIFEHEHILAPSSNESLRHVLVDKLRIINYSDFMKPEYEDYILDHNNKALDALSNLREVYRLSNNIVSSYCLLGDENVHSIDFLLFGLFKTKYPVAFSLFEHKWHEILLKVEHENYQYYELFQGEDKNGYFDFIQYLKRHQEEMSMNEFDLKTIRTILSELFKRQETVGDIKRINDVRWFNHYLNLAQLKFDIPEKEFNEVMNQPLDEIKISIDDWSVDKSVSLKHRLVNYGNNKLLNRNQLIKNIQAFFYASIINGWTFYDEINSVISHLKEFNDGNTFSDDDHTFILGQMKDSGYSIFMGKYVGYLFDNKKYSNISLNEADLIQVQQSVFSDCCKRYSCNLHDNTGIHRNPYHDMSIVLDTFSQLLNRDVYYYDFEDNDFSFNDNYIKSLVKSMQDFAQKHFEAFLDCVLREKFGEDWTAYRIRTIAMVIWGSWDHFRDDFLSKLDDSNLFIKKFKAFYNKFEENNYGLVDFNFSDN